MGYNMSFQNTSSDYSADTVEESTAVEERGALASLVSLDAVGFWLAVTLPVPTVLLLASGVSTIHELAAIGGLLVANLLAFYLGHGYSTTEP